MVHVVSCVLLANSMHICLHLQYTAEFGTDHVYNADTFNEMTPKSKYVKPSVVLLEANELRYCLSVYVRVVKALAHLLQVVLT